MTRGKEKICRDHFYYEEGEFCDSLDLPWDYCKEHKKKHVLFSEKFDEMAAPVDIPLLKWAQDWLVQHIKNTDFWYRGHLKHGVPEPYVSTDVRFHLFLLVFMFIHLFIISFYSV